MKNIFATLSLCLASALLAGGCHSVKVEGPTVAVPSPKPALSKVKKDVERDYFMNPIEAKNYGLIDNII